MSRGADSRRGPSNPRPATSIVETEAPVAADIEVRTVNEPFLVTHRDTFHRRTSRVVLGVSTMIASFAFAILGPAVTGSSVPTFVGLPMIGVGFAITVTAPLDRESTQIPPSRTPVGLAFSGRF